MVHILGQEKLADKIEAFKAKRANIEKLQAEVNAEKRQLDTWVATTEICKKWQAKAETLNKEVETYKAEMKAQFGIADGERTDILELVQAMKKVATLD
jgi:hypothetical protein